MIFYLLLNHIATIFVKMGVLTTLSFESPIINFVYGGGSEVFIEVTNNQKTLIIKPNKKLKGSNLLIITKRRKYYFNLEYSNKAYKFIEIKPGRINHSYSKTISKSSYEILEGKTSLLFRNKSKKSIWVNEFEIKKRKYLSKGIPLTINQHNKKNN